MLCTAIPEAKMHPPSGGIQGRLPKITETKKDPRFLGGGLFLDWFRHPERLRIIALRRRTRRHEELIVDQIYNV
jgi:hypothetical protein